MGWGNNKRVTWPDVPFWRIMELVAGWEPPDIIEFVVSDKYLDRGQILYPRQATLLKTIFLQDDLFTQYDYDILGHWGEQYQATADERGYGNNGIVPDVLDRIRINQEDGRRWFREVLAVVGRRGSKGYIGGLAGAYVLWNYLCKGDPQGFYGVDRSKQLAAQVFAGKKEQAVKNQWGDLNNVITEAPCFNGLSEWPSFIAKPLDESLEVFSPNDFVRRFERGVDNLNPSFLVEAKESTTIAARGPASFMQIYDEMAHVTKSVAKNDAGQVYNSATPALDQFKKDAFLYEPSSPWQKIGKFYENYEEAVRKEADGSPARPEMLMFQLTSWNPYEDWERAEELDARPEFIRDGKRIFSIPFNPLKGAVQAYDEQMQRLERANPETFAVERRSHWQAVMDAYLNEGRIKEMWQPWPGSEDRLYHQDRGILSIDYRAHGDPSKSGANFGFAVGHVAGRDERDLPHVVFDLIHHWDPADFPDHQIDYDQIAEEISVWMDGFMFNELTFDQFNSVATIQTLQKHARAKRYPKRVTVYERPATAQLNWKTYETFKTALGLGLIHAPFYEQADLELTFLQDLGGKVEHPTAGPVQTKDVADCMAIVTYELIGNEMAAFIGKSLGDLPLGGSQPGGMQPFGQEMAPEEHQMLSQFGRSRRSRVGAAPMGRPRRRY